MREILTFAIVAIALLSVVIIAIAMNKSYQSEQIAQQQYEAEQSSKLQSQAEESAKLQYEAEQNEKLHYEYEQKAIVDYELMCKNIEENSDYYTEFSEKFISVFEEFVFYWFNNELGFYEPPISAEILEYESDNDLLGYESYIRNLEGYSYVELEYPDTIDGYAYCNKHDEYHYYHNKYMVIYIPDEYMNKETIDTIMTTKLRDLTYIKDNLFVAFRLEIPC
jgi:hypothetical protein